MFWLVLGMVNVLGLFMHIRRGDATGAMFSLIGVVGSTLLFFGDGDA